MKKEIKIIFHIDLNAFYASCAIIEEPYLKDKVFVVGGRSTSNRGVVSTASYKARAYGIHSAMNINDAYEKYAKLVIVPTDFALYNKYSNHFFSFLKTYSSLILAGSIDEAYVDMTERAKKQHPLEIAKEIQEGLLATYQLPCSIGIAPTLFLAKMASDMKKPLGITVLRKKDIVKKLFPLHISNMYGIGKKTYPKLIEQGIATIGDFARKSNRLKILQVMSEANYYGYLDHIMGKSSDVIDPKKYRIPQSISNETTLNYAMDEAKAILSMILNLLETTHNRLTREELVTKTIGIRFRTTSFETFSRSTSLGEHTDDLVVIKEEIEALFDRTYDGEALRLVGVFFNQIMLKSDLKQDFNLFTYQSMTKREERLYETLSELKSKYPDAMKKAKS
jgi:DNA polymerase IV